LVTKRGTKNGLPYVLRRFFGLFTDDASIGLLSATHFAKHRSEARHCIESERATMKIAAYKRQSADNQDKWNEKIDGMNSLVLCVFMGEKEARKRRKTTTT
jgi:hypothetical protein